MGISLEIPQKIETRTTTWLFYPRELPALSEIFAPVSNAASILPLPMLTAKGRSCPQAASSDRLD